MYTKIIGSSLLITNSFFAVVEQNNMSLNYDPITMKNGVVTTQPASAVDKKAIT